MIAYKFDPVMIKNKITNVKLLNIIILILLLFCRYIFIASKFFIAIIFDLFIAIEDFKNRFTYKRNACTTTATP